MSNRIIRRLITATQYQMCIIVAMGLNFITIQYGNMQLVANLAGSLSASSVFSMGYESLALINMITQAGSLYGT